MLRITLAGILGTTLALTGTAVGQEANTSVHFKTITLHDTLQTITGSAAANIWTPPPPARQFRDLDVVRFNVLRDNREPVTKTVLSYEPGGYLQAHDRRFQELAAQGGEIEITGLCQSACTIILGYISKQRICIGKNAWFNFHLARKTTNDNIDLQASQWMMDRYPSEVRDWINARGGIAKMPANTYWTLPASELWKMGYRKCAD